MSKRSKEAAWKLFPIQMESVPLPDGDTIEEDVNRWKRVFAKIGYEQAERDLADAFQAEYAKELARSDLALTIEDIELLHTFLYAIKNNKHGCFTFTRLSNEQYEEVLRRFKSFKENKK